MNRNAIFHIAGLICGLVIIVIGLLINSGAILFGGVGISLLALLDLIRQGRINLSSSIWLRKNANKILINIYSTNNSKELFEFLQRNLHDNIIIMVTDNGTTHGMIDVKTLFELNRSYDLSLDESFIFLIDDRFLQPFSTPDEPFEFENLEPTEILSIIREKLA